MNLLYIVLFDGLKRWRQAGRPLRLQVSMLGSFGRRRSHPIKIANLAITTQRLCSNARHQMEMEYEDLNIISDARRHKSSSAAKKPQNKNKNRYVNILPCSNPNPLFYRIPILDFTTIV